MDFAEQIQALTGKIEKTKDMITTEEATKNAFVMPFINMLGYDVFNPAEVVPEFVADQGVKQGEKVDYAILKDDVVVMLIECKKCGADLGDAHASQLFRYFSVTHTRLAILTNGVIYRFYADLDEQNKMDQKPFLEVDMLNIQEQQINELRRFTKPAFDVDEMITTASDLKYTKEIKRIMGEELESPSDDFVRFFLTHVYSGFKTQSVITQFRVVTKRALNQFINDRINARLESAISREPVPPTDESDEEDDDEQQTDDGIVTTEEELEGFFVIKSILRQHIDPDRIHHRDTRSYFGVILDDNRRKPICRLYFDTAQKRIGLFDEKKNEERVPIDSLNDIYEYADRLKASVQFYDGTTPDEGQE